MERTVSIPSLHQIPFAARAWIVTLVCLIPSLWLFWHQELNILVSLVILLLLLVVSNMSPKLGICITIAFLFLLGDIRRIVGSLLGFPTLDTLLLVGPIVSVALGIPLLIRLRLTDGISKAVFALMVMMTLEIFNPHQGSVVVGLSGAMFYLVPMFWFWIGRRYGTDSVLFILLYRVLFPLGVLAAILGLCQTYIGFLPWESAWIAAVSSHYHALNLGGGFIRPFGFSVNGVEYADLLLLSCSFTLATFFAGRRVYAIFFPVLAAALFLASSRTAIIKLLFSVAASWALSSKGGRGWAVRLPFAFAAGIGALAFVLSQVGVANNGHQTSAAQASTQHQLSGLSHPLDSRYSTAGAHSQLLLQGVLQGFRNPLGSGIGSTTLGSGKFGGGGDDDDTDLHSSEVDISDSFIAMGCIGGIIYLATILLVLKRAIVFGRSAPKYLALPALSLLAAMGGAWIALGQYGIAPLVWFVIGALSRSRTAKAFVPGRLAGVSAIAKSVRSRPRPITDPQPL
jgi:hypothetical protein